MNKAVFFDRDGVLNVDIDYISNINQVEFYPGTADIIADFRLKGYRIFVVTNQPIIARGMIAEQDLQKLNLDFQQALFKHNENAVIDKIAYCPHHPNANIAEYRKNCECRKPKPGMILELAEKYNIDLQNSYMIGDRISDIIAGYLAGCKTVQCLTGKHLEAPITSELTKDPEMLNLKPDYIINNVAELKGIIL